MSILRSLVAAQTLGDARQTVGVVRAFFACSDEFQLINPADVIRAVSLSEDEAAQMRTNERNFAPEMLAAWTRLQKCFPERVVRQTWSHAPIGDVYNRELSFAHEDLQVSLEISGGIIGTGGGSNPFFCINIDASKAPPKTLMQLQKFLESNETLIRKAIWVEENLHTEALSASAATIAWGNMFK